jgi:DNA-binding response OmpR family regulator
MFRFRRRRIQDCQATLPPSELIQRTRIVVIDDNSEEFPFEVLKKQGYSIDHWEHVHDLAKLESGFYDIIVLDIGGVGQFLDKDNEGVGVLKHLKKTNPAQIVIAYSGQSHEPARIPFFKLADQFVPKPTSAITWKEILDDVMTNRLTVAYLWEGIERMLEQAHVSRRQKQRIEAELIKAVETGNSAWQGNISRLVGTFDRLATLLTAAGKIVLLCTGSHG